MRIAAGLILAGAVSLCASGAAWSQTPAPKGAAVPQATPAAPAVARAPAKPPCANPDALGIARVVEIDTTGGPGFGFEHFKQLDFLKDKEVVLTFDDGPWLVNTASLCGFTPQYAGLQELWTEFRGRGLMIIGVPSNDFGAQEPGGPTEIAETAQHHYGVTFPIAAKAAVKGPNAHPFYKWAAEARPKDLPRWNFHKYLIGRDGYLAEVFPESVEPADTRVKTAIARALADT